MRYYITILVITCSIAFPAVAAEDYYYWVDENGVKNFSQRSPTGQDAEFVTRNRRFGERIPETDRDQTPNPVPTGQSASEIDPDALVAEERQNLSSELAALRASNCEIGKRNLAQLLASRRIRVTDDKGENRVLSEEEKQAKMDVSRKVIREYCSG
jgi:hypothetical protein